MRYINDYMLEYLLFDKYMCEYMWMSLVDVFFNTNLLCQIIWINTLYKIVELHGT
jgi:hypothetical protein